MLVTKFLEIDKGFQLSELEFSKLLRRKFHFFHIFTMQPDAPLAYKNFNFQDNTF